MVFSKALHCTSCCISTCLVNIIRTLWTLHMPLCPLMKIACHILSFLLWFLSAFMQNFPASTSPASTWMFDIGQREQNSNFSPLFWPKHVKAVCNSVATGSSPVTPVFGAASSWRMVLMQKATSNSFRGSKAHKRGKCFSIFSAFAANTDAMCPTMQSVAHALKLVALLTYEV